MAPYFQICRERSFKAIGLPGKALVIYDQGWPQGQELVAAGAPQPSPSPPPPNPTVSLEPAASLGANMGAWKNTYPES